MKTLNWVILLVLGLSLTSMTARPSFIGKEENNLECFMDDDTIKYILFTSSSHLNDGFYRTKASAGENTGFVLFNESLPEGPIFFSSKFEPVPVMKSKVFLDSITYMNWDMVKNTLTKEYGEKLDNYFHSKCRLRPDEPYKKVHLYFIDKNDFTDDSLKVFKVHCMLSRF